MLCLQYNAIPGQPNIAQPNSQIDFGSSKFTVPRRITSFPRINRPRRIGISSFGLSGTLAHIIIEDPIHDHISQTSAPHLFLLSAHDQDSYKSLLEKYLEFAISPGALEVEFKAICATSQRARDHLPLRRAWAIRDHRSWVIELLKESRDPRPRRRFTLRPPRLGVWFGLPLHESSPESPGCQLLDQERTCAKGNWDDRYRSFAHQLAVANALKMLGCDITAIGGDGMGEWVAAVFAGVLPIGSVFQKHNHSHLETYAVQESEEKLRDLLTEWLPSELALRGNCGERINILEGTPEAAKEFAEVGRINISHNLSLAPSEPPRMVLRLPSIPIVSGHLGGIIDNDTAANSVYWANAAKRYFETSRGIEYLATQCDLVVHFGGSSLPPKSEGYIHFDSAGFEHTLAQLHEMGCNINWGRFGADEQLLHLPVYEW